MKYYFTIILYLEINKTFAIKKHLPLKSIFLNGNKLKEVTSHKQNNQCKHVPGYLLPRSNQIPTMLLVPLLVNWALLNKRAANCVHITI